jgi:pimeloyl-ACP methyl ester carboxylesterase
MPQARALLTGRPVPAWHSPVFLRLPTMSLDATSFLPHFRSPQAHAALSQSYDRVLAHWPVPVESRHVDTRRGRAHLLVCGPAYGVPVLLLHGEGGNATTWVHMAGVLAGALRVYAVDIVGDAGRSEGRRPASEDDYCDWLEDVLIGVGRPKVGLCGVSFGAWLAAAYMRRSLRRVSKLALLAPPRIGPRRVVPAACALLARLCPSDGNLRRLHALSSSPRACPLPEWALEDLLVRWRSQGAGLPRAAGLSDAEMRLLPAGTRVLLGEDDALHAIDIASRRLRINAPRVELMVVPDAGHAIEFDQAQRVGQILLDHFRGRGYVL